jgi:hypothetical protein
VFGSPKHDAAVSRGAAICEQIPDSGIEGGIELAIAVSVPRIDARFMDLIFEHCRFLRTSPDRFRSLHQEALSCEAELRVEILEKSRRSRL